MSGGGKMLTLIRKIFLDKKGMESKVEVIRTQKLTEQAETRYYLNPTLYLPECSLNRDITQMDGTVIRWEIAKQEDVEHDITL